MPDEARDRHHRADRPLSPAQQRVLERLGADATARPSFDADLGLRLRAELERQLEPTVEAASVSPEDPLFLSKHPLTQVLGCEGRFLAEHGEPFAWTVPMARGTVAHKAIELTLGWRGDPAPARLVDEAIGRLIESDSSLADFLQTAGEADLAELRTEATERVTTFAELFPPLRPEWRPVTESKVRVELHGGAIVLAGKVDLALGRASGTTAGKVLVDLKTGRFRPEHVDDLRFYALLETCRVGTPPRLLCTFLLDEGRPVVEAVTVDVLVAAVRRTTAAATRIVALTRQRDPATLRPGPGCRWCPVRTTCAAASADDDLLGW